MKLITRCAAGLLVIGAFLCGGGTEQASAANCTTPTLLSDATVSGFTCLQQDKIYSDFSASGTPSSFTAGATLSFQVFPQGGVDLHTITVTDSFVPENTYTLDYTIAVVPGSGATFSEVSGGILLAAGVPPGGSATLEKSFTTDNGALIPSILATVANPSPPPETVPAGVTSIHVHDVFFTDATDVTGFSNTFAEHVVPEPASLLLLGSGLIGMGLIRRRRRH